MQNHAAYEATPLSGKSLCLGDAAYKRDDNGGCTRTPMANRAAVLVGVQRCQGCAYVACPRISRQWAGVIVAAAETRS